MKIIRVTHIKNASFITNKDQVDKRINKNKFEIWLDEEKIYLEECLEVLAWIKDSEHKKQKEAWMVSSKTSGKTLEKRLEKIDKEKVTEGLSGLAATAFLIRAAKNVEEPENQEEQR